MKRWFAAGVVAGMFGLLVIAAVDEWMAHQWSLTGTNPT